MKKRLLIPFLSFMLILGGCEDILDKKPYEMYEDDFILTTEDGMDLLLNGAYDLMSGRNYYGALLYLYEASKGPDFFVRNVAGGFSFYTENRYYESSTLNGNARSAWVNIYLVIRNTTLLIENIDGVRGNIEELRRVKGEAYAIRGLAYFDLMRLFAYPPVFSIPGHPRYEEQFRWGVPIINTVEMGTDIFEHEVRRQTADSTYRYVIDQFRRSERLLEGRTVARGHADAAAVKALLIRAYLYLEDWDEVIRQGEEWIEKYGERYSMIPWDSYPTTYHVPFNTESVWELGYQTSDNIGSNSLNYWVRRPTWNEPGMERDGTVSQNLGYSKLGLTYGHSNRGYDFLNNYGNDARRYLICRMGIEAMPDYLTVRKYVGDPYHFVHNIPVVRLPEVYLSIAEAYASIGDNGSATVYTSMVSQPRRKADASITAPVNVLNERRREFILEGHTYWDYFRTARNVTNRQIIESIGNATITFGNTSGANYRAVYPIPLSEMNANPAIRDQKNPGYADWVFAIEEE